jgi:hypothetical protein
MPQFYYFLSNDEHPVTKNLPLWNAAIPLSRTAAFRKPRAPEDSSITYAEYFKAVVDFLAARSFKAVHKAVSSVLNRKIHPNALAEIRIYLAKHGAFYHPAKIVTLVEKRQVVFVLNVAISAVGREYMAGECHHLRRLDKTYWFGFTPKIYAYGCVQIDSDRQVRMFLGEWFEGYHEFHVTEEKDRHIRRIAVWDPQKGKFFLSKAQATKLYEEASTILTAYYNLESYEQIFSWHHAAGDFVVNLSAAEPKVKLVTVRRYEALFNERDDDPAARVNALLLFLLNMSIRMRIDRIDGVGELSWTDDFVMEGILRGFFKGLRLAAIKAAVPDTFIATFKAFLKAVPENDFFELFHAIMERMGPANPDQAVVRSHVNSHARVFLKMMPRFLDA